MLRDGAARSVASNPLLLRRNGARATTGAAAQIAARNSGASRNAATARHGVVFCSALCVLVAGCGGNAQIQAQRIDNPHAAVLRVADLPRGYREGDDTVCGLATTEGDHPELQSLFVEEQPLTACSHARRRRSS